MADGTVSDQNTILQYLDVFRKQGHYCDLVVIVKGERFRCHRFILAATSGYFNSLFNSSFPDSTAAEIKPLNDIEANAEIFRLILNYMYTGKIAITVKNAYVLLKTSDYLVMKELKTHCTQFIDKNPQVENTLKICHLAFSPMSDSEFAKIAVKNAWKNFQQVIKTKDFLSIDFPLLESILEQKSKEDPRMHCNRQMEKRQNNGLKWYCTYCGNYSSIEEQISFDKLADWIMYDVVGRIKHFPKLANFADLDSKYIKHWETLISRYTSELGLSVSTLCDSVTKPSLIIFAMVENNHVAVFHWDESSSGWLLCNKYEASFDNLKILSTGYDEYLLTSASTKDETTAQFWIDKRLEEWIELPSPPVSGKKYTIARIDNSIFLYMCDENLIRSYETLSCSDLKPEIGKNNIYVYMLELQKWLSIPAIPKFLFNSYFVTVNKLLFVVSGTTKYSLDCGAPQRIMQLYDPQTKEWCKKSFDMDLTLKGSACSFSNKIFICEEMKVKRTRTSKIRAIYVYDLISEQWTMEGVKQNAASIKVLIPYDSRLWAIPNSAAQKVEVYDLGLKAWSEVANLPLFVKINEVDCEMVEVLDGIV